MFKKVNEWENSLCPVTVNSTGSQSGEPGGIINFTYVGVSSSAHIADLGFPPGL